jgi:hypothetical protein
MEGIPGREGATFILAGGDQTGKDSGFLGLWSMAPEPQLSRISFSSPGETPPVIWRCDLPGDLEKAGAIIYRAEAGLQANQAALEEGEQRLNALTRTKTGGFSFSLEAFDQELPEPERETLALLSLSQADRIGVSFDIGEQWDSVSFGPVQETSGKWNQATQKLGAFFEQLKRVVGHYAWVETRVQGQLLARSTVNWIGDLETACSVLPDAQFKQIHERSLRLALASRAAMLRTFGVISASAIKLSALLATPAGAILALPAAFHFINQVQAEWVRHQQSLENANGN